MSSTSFAAAFHDELKQIFCRQPKLALLLFGVPLLCSLLFGSIYGGNVLKEIPLVICDQDQTQASRALVQAFADSERYLIIRQVGSQNELEATLQENAALAAISIPPDFASDIKAGRASQVMVTSSSDNLLYANAIISSSQEIIQSFAAGSAAKLVESLGQPPDKAANTTVPLRFGIRLFNNPASSYNSFMLPSLGAHMQQLGIMLATSGLMFRLRTKSGRTISGSLAAYCFCSFLAYWAHLLLLQVVYGIPNRGDFLEISLLGLTFTAALTAIGSFFSVLARTELEAVQLPMLYIMPASLFSGFSWPFAAMDDFCRSLAALMPLSYIADPLRDLMLAGHTPGFWQKIGVLLLFNAVFLAACILIAKKKFKEATS